MEKELNLVELLKDAPKGTKLFSPIFGECELLEVKDDEICVNVDGQKPIFFANGTYCKGYGECLLFPSKENRDWSTFKVEKEGFKVGDHVKDKETGEVRILTQKAQQPSGGFWTKRVNCSFNSTEVYIGKKDYDRHEKVSKFDPKWLKPFDRVLAFDNIHWVWIATLFSHITEEDEDTYPYIMCDASSYPKCIPYNEETKHLVGTSEEEPEFYKFD